MKRNLALRGLIPLCLFFFSWAYAQSPVLPRQIAVDAVIAELGLNPGDHVRVWSPTTDFGYGPGFEGTLPPGTVVRPKVLGGDPYPGNTLTTSGLVYLFFVDDLPNGLFAHPTRFVYVDATMTTPTLANGGLVVQDQGWWPVIQRPGFAEEEWFGSYGRTSYNPAGAVNPEGLVFGYTDSLPAPSPQASTRSDSLQKATANSCALIITGTPGGAAGTAESGLEGSADGIKAELKNQGIPDGRIQDKRNANKADIQAAVQALCNTPDCDKIYVYIGSHGLKNQIQLGSDGMVSENDLCDLLKPLGEKGVPVCIMIEACHSGSMVDVLRPKFPKGVIITVAGPDDKGWSGTVQNPDGTDKGDFGFFACAFLRCWKDANADTDGDGKVSWTEAFKWVCKPGNGKVRWGGREWDVKSKNPVLEGLPVKTIRFQDPTSGAWYTETKRDTDKDGAYDQCDWSRDDDCDGIADVIYLDDDYDEDGNDDKKVCIRDSNDDGTPETKYRFIDKDDDGDWEEITCYTMRNGEWVKTAAAPPRSQGSFRVHPYKGSSYGGSEIVIDSEAEGWFAEDLKVFIGSDVQDAQLLGGYTIQGTTRGYHPGPVDAVVADFDPNSPSYGFDQVPNAFTYTPELFVDGIEPFMGACKEVTAVEIYGRQFQPDTQVWVGDMLVPSTWVNGETLIAEIPGERCGQTLDIRVQQPGLGDIFAEATLTAAFHVGAAPDNQPPVITAPPKLTLFTDYDGLARLPAEFQATAWDDSGPVSITRNHAGALAPGRYRIGFEAVDVHGNRATAHCPVTVMVGAEDKTRETRENRAKRLR